MLSPFGVLDDSHDRLGVGRGRGGRRFGGRGGHRVAELLMVVQVLLVRGGRLEDDGRAAAEGTRVVRGGGRGVLVERPVQVLVTRVAGRQRRHRHGWRPSVCRGGRRGRRRLLAVGRSLALQPAGRRRRRGGRRLHRGRRRRRRRRRRVLAGHVGQ